MQKISHYKIKIKHEWNNIGFTHQSGQINIKTKSRVYLQVSEYIKPEEITGHDMTCDRSTTHDCIILLTCTYLVIIIY